MKWLLVPLVLILTLVTAIALDVHSASAQETWTVTEVTDGSVDEDFFSDTRDEAPNGLPDGRIAELTLRNQQDIREAWYSEPTRRYPHGALGDEIEAGALKVRDVNGQVFTFRLPRTEVFEDITPRLVDLDRDGRTEVVTILSSTTRGASVAVFGLVGNAIIKKAQTEFLGRRFRWLNIAGIARFRGLFRPEIAIVEKPHLEGVLKFYRYRNGQLTSNRSAIAFSNHEFGSNELRLSAIAEVNNDGNPDLLIPSFDRKTLFAIGVSRTAFTELARIALPAAINRAIAVEGARDNLKITVGLDDNKIYSIQRQ